MIEKAAEVFERRDGLSKQDAETESAELKNEALEIIESGGSYEEVADLLLGHGLEMDYIEDMI